MRRRRLRAGGTLRGSVCRRSRATGVDMCNGKGQRRAHKAHFLPQTGGSEATRKITPPPCPSWGSVTRVLTSVTRVYSRDTQKKYFCM